MKYYANFRKHKKIKEQQAQKYLDTQDAKAYYSDCSKQQNIKPSGICTQMMLDLLPKVVFAILNQLL